MKRSCWMFLFLAFTFLLPSKATDAAALQSQGTQAGAQATTQQSKAEQIEQLKSRAERLQLGKPVVVDLKKGERKLYLIAATSGQFLHVVVEQQGVHVDAELYNPGGDWLASGDADNGSFGPQTVSAIAAASGDFWVVVDSQRQIPTGKFTIQLTDLGEPTDADRKRIAAERASHETEQLFTKDDAESSKQAIAKGNEGLELWRALGDKYEEALTLWQIGEGWGNLVERQKAIAAYNEALTLWTALDDKPGEAIALNAIGLQYSGLGQKQKALDYYGRALAIRQELKDTEGEAGLFNNFGAVYQSIGENEKALDEFTKALGLYRDLGDRASETLTLGNLGVVYAHLGDETKSVEFQKQSLQIALEEKDASGAAEALNSLGSDYEVLGEMQDALDCFNKALAIREKEGDRGSKATILANIGVLYSFIGERQKAIDYLNQALPIFHDLNMRGSEATTLVNIGDAYHHMNQALEALDYYRRALPIQKEVGDRAGEGETLDGIGRVYQELSDKQNAIDYYNQSLEMARATNNRMGEAAALSDIGTAYELMSEYPKAVEYYDQALPLYHAARSTFGEASTLFLLMTDWELLHNLPLATFYGKESIDLYQKMRRNLAGFDQQAQQAFVKSRETYYRMLADILVAQGRLSEAQEVLDMLKLEEFSEFTQRRGDASAPGAPVDFTLEEKAARAEYEDAEAEVASAGVEWSQLRAKQDRTPDEEKRYEALGSQVTAANQKMRAFLTDLAASFSKREANRSVEQIRGQAGGLQRMLTPGLVAIYTLVLDDKCVLIVLTGATQTAFEVPVKRTALSLDVNALLTALQGNKAAAEIQQDSRKLYDLLIAPIQKSLDAAKAETIVWCMDDVLRYVPTAALYDGSHYMVEKYKQVTITPASMNSLTDAPDVAHWHAVAMGVSKDYDGLGALQAVPEELDSVVRSDAVPESHGPLPGTILLNDAFTERDMARLLEQHPPLVHIASHYVFRAGDDTKSYLLLGGKDAGGEGYHLTLADVENNAELDFSGVELLTLSACQTAMGTQADGREVDGLGMVAQQRGAKAVMATLWPVDDASVGELMATFYETWTSSAHMSKAEALRQAQLALLRGTGSNGAQESYANPFYWAPFILIGNWK